MSISFRWLGAAGIVLQADHQVLAIDPFLSRPTLSGLLHPLTSDIKLVEERLLVCNHVLVTHSHYDHLMDVPTVLRVSGARAYGSRNTRQLLGRSGIPSAEVQEVGVGDRLTLGPFSVEVIEGQHSSIPLGNIFNGSLKPDTPPPRYAWDYKMDLCLGFRITVQGSMLLVCAAEPLPADVLFIVAQEPEAYYRKIFQGVRPKVLVPIHWDNFTSPLSKPLREFTRPGRISVDQLSRLARRVVPGCEVLIPQLFTDTIIE